MDTLQIQNSICQTIDIIVQNAINNAGFDRTIQATIISCTNRETGQYKVRYQDSAFYAYAQNAEDKYADGAGVYILIQNNDMTRDKFIIGSVDKLGKDYLTVTDESERYEVIGSSCVNTSREIQLCSYETGEYSLSNIITINNLDLLTYCKKAQFLTIKMNVRTALEREQRLYGNYGLKFKLLFYNKENPSVDKEEVYIVNIDSMTGDPYNYINPTSQFFTLSLNMDNFKGIKEISAFCEKFPIQKTDMPNDIFINDLEVCAANRLTEEELSAPHLRYFLPKGTIFKGDLKATAYGRINGTDVEKGEFYWFVKDNITDTDSPYYMPIGGKGWKCKNNFGIIEKEEDRIKPNETGEWTFKASEHLAAETIYKCVMRYSGVLMEKELILINRNSEYEVSIESSKGTKFYNDIGETVLTCNIFKNQAPVSNCVYKWIAVDNNNHVFFVNNGDAATVNVSASTIDGLVRYQCMVYTKDTNAFLGYSEIALVNSMGTEGSYYLTINNGSQTFIYTEEGVAPTNPNLENPVAIFPLSFTLYDNQGEAIPSTKIDSSQVQWKIPAANSLIQLKNLTEGAVDGYYYRDTPDLDFNIRSTYAANYTNNQIELTVQYQDLILHASTNLFFIKEGEIGSNGTGTIIRIAAKEKNNSSLLSSEEPMMYYVTSGNSFNKNYDILQAIVADATSSKSYSEKTNDAVCSWGILQNEYYNTNTQQKTLDATNLSYAAGAGFTQTTANRNSTTVADNIYAKIQYKEMDYFVAYPMIVAFVQDNNCIPFVRKGTGCRTVKYSTDGVNPKYTNAFPFTIGLKNSQGEIDVNNYKFKWTGETSSTVGKNTFRYQPSEAYDGRSVTSSLLCIIENMSGTEVARIHIPIYKYLNTYGHSALNDWNGNSISIDDKGGYILAPQMGAGEKDAATNTFTGLLMGQVKFNDENLKVGLVGLNKGQQTIFLDSKTGGAYFGTNGGQIRIVPGEEPIIEGGNYAKNQTGLQINLSANNPGITFGNGNFSVNSKGILTAKSAVVTDAQVSGEITATSGTIGDISLKKNIGIYTNEKTTINSTKQGFLISKDGGIYVGPYSNNYCPFQVNPDGSMYSIKGTIGGWTIEDSSLYLWGKKKVPGKDENGNEIEVEVEGKIHELGKEQVYFGNNAIFEGNLGSADGETFSVSKGQLTVASINGLGPISAKSIECSTFNCPGYEKTLTVGCTIYVEPSNANASDENKCVKNARFKSLQGAIDSIPRYMNGKTVNIILKESVVEDISFNYITGGVIRLYMWGNTIFGSVKIYDTPHVYIYGGTKTEGGLDRVGVIRPKTSPLTGTNYYSSVTIGNNSALQIYNIDIWGSEDDVPLDETGKGIDASRLCIGARYGGIVYASNIRILKTDFGFRASGNGRIYVGKSAGRAHKYGFYATSGGYVGIGGASSTDDLQAGGSDDTHHFSETHGGTVKCHKCKFDTTYIGEEDTSKVPVDTTPKTLICQAASADSIRYYGLTSAYWRNDGSIRVASWNGNGCHIPFWFFGEAFEEMKDKKVSKITITFTRNTGGYIESCPLRFFTHNAETKSDINVKKVDVINLDPNNVSKWLVYAVSTVRSGTEHTFTITDANIINNIKTSKGICSVPLHLDQSGTDGYYSVFSPTMKVVFTYTNN